MSQRIKRRLITGSLLRAASGLVGALLAGLLLWSEPMTAASAGSPDVAQSDQEARLLEPGKPIERELAGGQSHFYQLTLDAGQFLHVMVEQRGVDVVVILFGPDGKKLAEVDSPNGKQGPELVEVVAEAAGSYRLEVRALEKDAAVGQYEVRIEELRTATLQDRNRVAARNAYADGERLRAERTAVARRKALEKYEEALPLWRAAGDRRGEADTLHNLGYLHDRLGEPQKAPEYFEQALTLRRAIADRRGEADTLHSFGQLYNDFGENQKALDYYTQALALWRILGDRAGEAVTLNDLGVLYDDLDEKQRALDHYSQALLLHRALGNRAEEAMTLNNIGFAYKSLGEPELALVNFTQAITLWRTVGRRSGEALTLINLGGICKDLGRYREALDYYNQALTHSRDLGDRRREALALANVGGIHFSLGEPRKALDYFNQALAIERAVGNRAREGLVLNSLGWVHDSLDEFQPALDCYGQALSLLREAGDRNGEAKTLYGLAHTQRRRGRLAEARSQIVAATKIVENLRTKVSGPDLRASYFASRGKYYEFEIDLLMQMHKQKPSEGYQEMGLQTHERARARGLLDLLTEAGADIRQGVAAALLDQERDLQRQINLKEQRRMQALRDKQTSDQAAAVEEELGALLAQYQEVQVRIRATSPRYAALTQPQPLSLQEIQQQVLDDDTLLLEYALGEERSYLWAVSPTSITSFELPKRALIEDIARRVPDLLMARDRKAPGETKARREARIAQADAAYSAAAGALSRILLRPIASQLGTKRLLIVSDGALQYLPFAALPKPVVSDKRSTTGAPKPANVNNNRPVTNGYRPMMLDHEIVSLPSASTLAVLRRELAGRSPAPRLAAVLADPVFEATDPRVNGNDSVEQKTGGSQPAAAPAQLFISRALNQAGVVNPGQTIPRLPYSQREAAIFKTLAPELQCKLALGFEANYATATSPELSNYRIIHFATHGLLNSKQPELSGILLSLVDEQGRPQANGLLRLGEIYNLKLPAELVVLSACQTALGKEIRGEGLVGLTRGFMYAGTPRLVASLWKVDDVATAELMKRFYEGMLGKRRLRPAEALRQAQIAMWRQSEWCSPVYWGAFTFQGEWK